MRPVPFDIDPRFWVTQRFKQAEGACSGLVLERKLVQQVSSMKKSPRVWTTRAFLLRQAVRPNLDFLPDENHLPGIGCGMRCHTC